LIHSTVDLAIVAIALVVPGMIGSAAAGSLAKEASVAVGGGIVGGFLGDVVYGMVRLSMLLTEPDAYKHRYARQSRGPWSELVALDYRDGVKLSATDLQAFRSMIATIQDTQVIEEALDSSS
jgi:hypothetical protein